MIKTNQWTRTILLILLCLCLALPWGAASAEETVDLGTEGYDSLRNGTILSDGRILLCGCRQVSGDNIMKSARLLCLNPDRTVSWEYTDPVPDDGYFTEAAEQPDGTIGIVYGRYCDDGGTVFELRFFTPDGEPTGKVIRVSDDEDIYINNATKSRLLLLENKPDENTHTWLLDWDGNRIAKCGGIIYANGMMEEEDCIVLVDSRFRKEIGMATVIRKLDLRGNTVWETELPQIWPGSNNLQAVSVMPTEDGGYLEVQEEMTYSDIGIREYRTALIRLDADGQILWTSTDGLENVVDVCETAVMADGKLALYFLAHREEGPVSFRLDNTRTVLVFDENGKNTGKTELSLPPENFERLDEFIRANSDEEKELAPVLMVGRMFPTQDGLWLAATVSAIDRKNTVSYGESFDTVLIRLPQP